ncbi:hypothetical protein LT679_00615 [Mucilaginibacter roseus]|uniref:Uncharacterized protein n=1 Tax=Mucilaginibacter roseus TaxID=1528868 RepID=A0ABS8TXL0_9SPHI|nr:hypothetical protein [Mucilaginibacter roseus]MCD8739087.1 hypothetical protein [Mucilaginibacter roseus]
MNSQKAERWKKYFVVEAFIIFAVAMKNDLDQVKADVKRLHTQGVNLLNAIRDEQFPEQMEQHFTNVLKKDYQEFKKGLPVFKSAYQPWYSEAVSLIRILLPLRHNDFVRLYEKPKGRQEITRENYVIEDYLSDTVVTAGFDKKVVAGPDAAIPAFEQQYNIIGAVLNTIDSSLLDIRREIQAGLLDAELDKATLLAKNKLLRAAGVVAGIVLEKHLEQICERRQLKITRKTITDLNELLKKNEVIDFPGYRHISLLAELNQICIQNKKREPELSEIADLINGTDKVIKTVF